MRRAPNHWWLRKSFPHWGPLRGPEGPPLTVIAFSVCLCVCVCMRGTRDSSSLVPGGVFLRSWGAEANQASELQAFGTARMLHFKFDSFGADVTKHFHSDFCLAWHSKTNRPERHQLSFFLNLNRFHGIPPVARLASSVKQLWLYGIAWYGCWWKPATHHWWYLFGVWMERTWREWAWEEGTRVNNNCKGEKSKVR